MANKVMLFREAGRVRRLHTVPLTQHYDVAQHSYNMAVMAMAICPAPSQELIEACLFHDVHERWTGDAPAPVKWAEVNLANAMRAVEVRINHELNIEPNLTDSEQRWLKGLDLLELFLFCQDELRVGNTNVREVANTCHDILFREDTPEQIQAWLSESNYRGRTTNKMGVD